MIDNVRDILGSYDLSVMRLPIECGNDFNWLLRRERLSKKIVEN